MLKKGFTLAEVLTTLMVIGVVAAMTIPTLMNSTNEQQLKVAYKKAMSVLGQGVQLMTAKEVQCAVTDSASLAKCFQENALSGTIAGHDNTTSGTQNVIVTSDGLAYQFIYHGDADTGLRTVDEICGDGSLFLSSPESYAGDNGQCIVVVDLNGFSKGGKTFAAHNTSSDSGYRATQNGSEQIPIYLTGTGVRPIYVSDNSTINKGYEWMYGTAANPL